MVAQNSRRASGRTTGEVATKEASQELEEPVKAELPEDRMVRFERTGFNRMPMDFGTEDRLMMDRIHRAVDRKIDEYFGDLIAMQYELWCRVRIKVVIDGEETWKTTGPAGLYEEHWERFTGREREEWIYRISMNLVDWEKRATEAWGESMFAKALWEDAFSIGFELLPGTKPTVQDREARAKLESRDQRYFALLLSYYSRMAEGHVRNMRDLLLRLSQIHQAASSR